MTIYFYDGSTAECEEIEFYNNKIMWDHCRYADTSEIERIEAD